MSRPIQEHELLQVRLSVNSSAGRVVSDGTGFDPGVADAVVHEITTAGMVAVSCNENIESREGCQRLIEVAFSQYGRLDILINNAGWITFRSASSHHSRISHIL